MKDVNMILGERVRAGRKANGITREKLAEQVDVSPRFLAEVEAGKVGVSLQTLKNLSTALCVSTDYLLGLENTGTLDGLESLYKQIAAVDEKFYPLLSAILGELKNIG